MKTIPILFSTSMVQAILNGSKTQTRRIVKSKKTLISYEGITENNNFPFWKEEYLGFHLWLTKTGEYSSKPKAEVGDVFWVRETFNYRSKHDKYYYKADVQKNGGEPYAHLGWKPSIFMPKEACRLFLEVTNVRVERLEEISEEDAKAEGILIGDGLEQFHNYLKEGYKWKNSAIESFESLWLSINGKESWKKNPFVWVYDFKVIDKPKNFI